MVSAVNVGSVNMPKMLRHMRHRSSQVRDLTFVREPIKQKDIKTTKVGGSDLTGPAVSFGYEKSSSDAVTATDDVAYHAASPEIVLPGLTVLQSPIVSRRGRLEKTGHRISGACTFYTPSLDYIQNLDNFGETVAFGELESYDKLYDIERIIYNAPDSATNTSTNEKEWELFTDGNGNYVGQELAGYEIDRLQFKIKRTTDGNGTTTWNGIATDKITHLKIYDDSNNIIKLEPTSGTLAPRRGPNNTWNTFDIPIRDLTVNDKLSYYLNGNRLEFNVTGVGFDLDKMEGDTNTVKRIEIIFANKLNIEFKDVYLYKEAEWRIESIKDYRDEYMQIAAVRVRGDRSSRRRAYG